tara:strand:+ start:780 stop:1274 length:495 start_codon:yes stop_codon:yes gene_type:complete
MKIIKDFKFTLFYILSIALINVGFVYVPLIPFYDTMYPPMSIIVGIIFILRDFAQKEIGHKVFIAMLIGAFLSYIMANPYIAVASLVAFLVSETVDWGVYSFTKKPLHQRILFSSLLSTPIDSAIFLLMIGNFSILATSTMFVSKMLACLVIWYWLGKKNETYV